MGSEVHRNDNAILNIFKPTKTESGCSDAADQFVYSGFTGSNLTLDGGARITPSGLLELTNGMVRLKGHAFHPTPLYQRKSPNGTVESFSVSFVFAILCDYPDSCGHGLAFFIAPSKNFSSAFWTQYLGLVNNKNNGDPNNHIFATELDTVQNDDLQDIRTVSGKHYVLGWSFGMNSPAPSIDIAKLPRLDQKTRSKVLQTILPIAAVVFLLSAGTAIFFCVWRNLRYAELREDWEVEYGPQRFCYKDLFHATEGFKNKNLLGTGGFGSVYRGILPISRLDIAVKRVSHDSTQGMKEFIAEIVSIGCLQHRNLVKLLGYCRRKGELLLVYDYMPNGSLDKYLYGNRGKPTLDWAQRFQIIKGVASGLLYLHEESKKVIIHRDIKASNVLLDNDINAWIGDFGLARLYDHGTDPETTRVVGTIGYLAPELARGGKATPLTDVFAFGMFILEVICGKSLSSKTQKTTSWCLLIGCFNIGIKAHSLIQWTSNFKLLFLGLNLASFTIAEEQFIYSGFIQANLSLDGTATITPEGLLQLTNGTFNLKGHAFHPTPMQFRRHPTGNMQSFSLTFIFSILSTIPDKGADGMAFFISTNKSFSSALSAQYLGILNDQNNGNTSNHIFVVELDTIQNSEFQDISDNHVGININSLHSVQSRNAGFCDDKNGDFKNLTLISRELMQVWVEYDAGSAQVDVTLAPIKMAKPARPLVLAIYNLSTVLTDTAYVGFSSATGVINSRYYVLGWSFSMGGNASGIDIMKLPKLPHVGPRPRSKVLKIMMPVTLAASIFVAGILVIILVWRKLAHTELKEDWEAEFGPNRFSYKDLLLATEGFKNKNLLGTGGFGTVYKGILPTSKLEVAVKRLSHESKQGTKEFITESVSIGRLRHCNLVQPLGYCRQKGELLLVYDYMPNGSLDRHLYSEDKLPLDWTKRFHIIKGVASCLLYLHEECERVVIHRDIKASNVLLDREMNGCLGDFGLAKSYDHGTDPQTTRVVGTMGYLAPELNAQGDRFILVDWVLEHWQKGSMVEAIDKRLQGNCNIDEACLVLKPGLLCSQPFASTRPSMNHVMLYLNGDMQLPEFRPTDMSLNMPALMENRVFDPLENEPMIQMKNLIFFLLLILNAGELNLTAGDDNNNDGDQFVYSGFTGSNLTLDGAAVITQTGLLELTNGTLRQKSHAIHPIPFRLRRPSSSSPATAIRSFSSSFVFAIICPDADACGHGIVLFVAPANHSFAGAFPSQYIGLFNGSSDGDAANRLVGVELDTDQNNEFRDIDGNHVGVDINSLTSINSTSTGYYDDEENSGENSHGLFHNLTLSSHDKAMRVWVDYDATAKKIDVAIAPLKMAKPSRPLLSTTYDLSMVFVDDEPYMIGFSSATGSFNSKHYVLGWSFAMDGRPAPAIDIDRLPRLPRFAPKRKPKMVEIIPPLATAMFIIAMGIVSFVLVRRRMRYTELREDWEVEFGPHRFSYKDLFRATDGFKSMNLVGVGGFGRVYKGVLPSSKLEIAVKRVSHDSKQGMKEFIAEVVSIGRLQHRNLVQLLGYCRREGELLLVYEYMSNGSLDKHLYSDSGDKHVLNWDKRFQIIKGIASGLLYLHEEWEKVIVHRDIKTSNVLLDNEMNSRLGDFGLARLYDRGADPKTTHVVGTIGYLAPELGRSSKATPLTDIFAFGIFILEVTCGQRPIMQVPEGEQHVLVDWVLENWHKGSIIETVDTKLQGNYNVDEVYLVLKLGLLCSHPLSNERPNIRQVMKYLNEDMAMPELVPTHHNFHTLALMQNQGFDSYVMSYPSLASISTVSNLSEQR
uniref:non-specific serine/threonine protein kinase n=1 Tax=Leersia perrieri TaxID=77586 RepID=A0A0D9WV70_9ORYZ